MSFTIPPPLTNGKSWLSLNIAENGMFAKIPNPYLTCRS